MEILTLIIRKEHFDKIIKGKKTQEFREIRPKTQSKYCQVDKDGYAIEKEGILQPRKYDAIRFFVGYNKNRESALVEVKNASIELFIDEEDNFITYEENQETYIAAQVVYDLGQVINN